MNLKCITLASLCLLTSKLQSSERIPTYKGPLPKAMHSMIQIMNFTNQDAEVFLTFKDTAATLINAPKHTLATAEVKSKTLISYIIRQNGMRTGSSLKTNCPLDLYMFSIVESYPGDIRVTLVPACLNRDITDDWSI